MMYLVHIVVLLASPCILLMLTSALCWETPLLLLALMMPITHCTGLIIRFGAAPVCLPVADPNFLRYGPHPSNIANPALFLVDVPVLSHLFYLVITYQLDNCVFGVLVQDALDFILDLIEFPT
jgi:hypothetical protein